MIVYVSIGNSDDKLTQLEWHDFVADVGRLLSVDQPGIAVRHGTWVSRSDDRWQNACWCVEIFPARKTEEIKAALARLAAAYRQDSIAWAEVPDIEFLGPVA